MVSKITFIFLFLFFLVSCSEDSSLIDLVDEDLLLTYEDESCLKCIEVLNILEEEYGYENEDLETIYETFRICYWDLICVVETLDELYLEDFQSAVRKCQLPALNLEIQDQSTWTTTWNESSYELTLTHNTYDLVVTLDLDNGIDDKKSPGLFPSLNGYPYYPLNGDSANNLIKQSQDGGSVDSISVVIIGEEVFFNTYGGTYGEMGNNEDTDTVFMESIIYVEEHRFTCDLSGLYYIYMPKEDVTVDFTSEGVDKQFIVKTEDVFRRYQEDVDRVRIENAYPEKLFLFTDIERIQFDAVEGFNWWEIDTDHSYKDRNQKVVTSTFTIDAYLEEK